ncbi:YjgB family protein [Rossellomorea sp. AcN35-11]|nr:YjgB family protein [Rossellomorea aquimaris]WJV28348.1 YjgB family protein [Rossellomorea sp. AcN35-11]
MSQPVAAEAPEQNTKEQQANEILDELYNSSFTGEFPGVVEGLKLNKSTKEDVFNLLGQPTKDSTGDFDVYYANMGHPGYAFSYADDGTIKEIRYLGTNIQRQTNLGGITEAKLLHELGVPDSITPILDSRESKLLYTVGEYHLEFIIGNDPQVDTDQRTVTHVNLVN